MSSARTVLVLSPHRDDAAFSCGLLCRHLLVNGFTIAIANVCTISDYAPYLHESSLERSVQVTAAREAEDAAFLTVLAESAGVHSDHVQLIDLAWRDAPLRHSVPVEQVLNHSPQMRHNRDEEEIADLVQEMQALPHADFIFAPLAIGGHIDHRMTRDAAIASFAPEKLLFYEDLPYACRTSRKELEATVVETLTEVEAVLLPDTAEKNLKQAIAACYPSQIAFSVAEELEAYARTMDYRERFYAHPRTLAMLKRALAQNGVLV